MDAERDRLIVKYLSGIIDEKEREALFTWVGESPDNRRILEEYRILWETKHAETLGDDYETAVEWEKLQSSLRAQHRQGKQRFFIASWLKVAASLALIVMLGVTLYLLFFKTAVYVHETVAYADHFTMPDGSKIWLNANSRLTFTSGFGDGSRKVELSGEAFFDVAKDSLRPFIIKTPHLQVTVLGTSFNVSAVEHRPESEVVVMSGRVSVSKHDQSGELVVEPGEKAVWSKVENTLVKSPDVDPNVIAWKTRRLMFNGTALKNVIRRVEDYFKVAINIKNPDLLGCRFTSSFYDPRLEEVIEALSISLDLTVIRQGDVFVIDGKGCNTGNL